MLSAFPSLAVVIYLTVQQQVLKDNMPLDVAVGIPMIIFLVGDQPVWQAGR